MKMTENNTRIAFEEFLRDEIDKLEDAIHLHEGDEKMIDARCSTMGKFCFFKYVARGLGKDLEKARGELEFQKLMKLGELEGLNQMLEELDKLGVKG